MSRKIIYVEKGVDIVIVNKDKKEPTLSSLITEASLTELRDALDKLPMHRQVDIVRRIHGNMYRELGSY